MEGIGAVILAGGKSRRMGRDKALLRLEGETFLKRISKQLSGFDEVLLSADRAERYAAFQLKAVADQCPGLGPMGGLYSALSACDSQRLLAVSCDMPFFTRGLAEYMCGYVVKGYDAFALVTRDEYLQPLCAIYEKSAAPVLKEQIERKNYRMRDALERMRVKRIPLRHSVYPDEAVRNINTPEEYAGLRRQYEGPPVIAVSGLKNSGKTTLLLGIIPRLCGLGLRVAVVKHDGHDFVPDVPGTDSFRFREAGAYGAAVYSEARYMLTAERGGLAVGDMTKSFPDADLILVEGGKFSDYPKIEVVRRGISDGPVCSPDTLLALCTDLDLNVPGVPVLAIDDHDGIVQVLTTYLQRENEPCLTVTDGRSITRESQ